MSRYNEVDYSKFEDYHRFVDEAGDLTFFKKGRIPVTFGEGGVSKYLILGMVHVKDALSDAERKVRDFGKTIENDDFFENVPSVKKRIEKYGYFIPHAKDDPAEIRLAFFRYLAKDDINFSMQAVLGRKNFERFAKSHNSKDREFYGDLLAYLLQDKANYEKLVVNIASRVSATDNTNLSESLLRAKQRYANRSKQDFNADIKFNVQPYAALPLLSIVDYCLWAVQRLVERDEDRYYKLISNKIPFIFDAFAEKGSRKNFTRSNPLSSDDLNSRV